METNIDEQLLISQRVDVNSEQHIISQVLRITVYDEFHAYEAYSAIIEKFGNINPFVNIKESEAVHYSALMPLCEKYSVQIPINNWAEKIEVPNTLLECFELGVAAELNNIKMYDNLIEHTKEVDVKDVLYRLQAASYNNHLPAFRAAVQAYNNVNIENESFSSENIMNKVGEYQELLEDITSGNMDETKITKLLGKMNISMISGAAMGSAGIALLNTYNKNNKE